MLRAGFVDPLESCSLNTNTFVLLIKLFTQSFTLFRRAEIHFAKVVMNEAVSFFDKRPKRLTRE
jgi:hypothetical protein